jgi:hypothetical protein
MFDSLQEWSVLYYGLFDDGSANVEYKWLLFDG